MKYKHVTYGVDFAVQETKLSESSLEDALAAINRATGKRGMKLSIQPTKLIMPAYSKALAESMKQTMSNVWKDVWVDEIHHNPHRRAVKRLSLDVLCDMWKARFGMEPIVFAQEDDFFEAVAARLVCAKRMKKLPAKNLGGNNDYNVLINRAYQLKKERY